MRALIIDDSRANRMILVKFLRELGFETAEAESGLDAIWMLKERADFDVITVDYHMPRMTGVQFARLVRTKPELERVQILMITSDLGRYDEAVEAGISEFIMKPFDQATIKETLTAMGLIPNTQESPQPEAPPA